MSDPLTLGGFLEQTGATLRVYDMGRRITRIDRACFRAVELTEQPYPYPLRGQAWFALVQTHPDTEPLIWFLHFELDEQGRLILASRDHFLHAFIEIATSQTQHSALQQLLNDSPYSFRPGDEKMANLHAIVARDLGAPASTHLAHALDYFDGKLGWEQWSFVGLQGIADTAARLDQHSIAKRLARACPHLPDEPLIALCHSLEHQRPAPALAAALLQRLERTLQADPHANRVAALIRGLAQASQAQLRPALKMTLAHAVSGDAEVLAAIGGRAWEALLDPEIARAYLARLTSEPVSQALFNHCLSDLLRLPGLRQPLLQLMRDPARPEALGRAFQAMLDG